jgi:hypothetical protein
MEEYTAKATEAMMKLRRAAERLSYNINEDFRSAQ